MEAWRARARANADKVYHIRREIFLNRLRPNVSLANSSILEIGVGDGKFGKLLGEDFASYRGIDINSEKVAVAKTRIPRGTNVSYVVGDALNIPLKGPFDIIFYSYSWHCINNYERALEEANRVLEKKGIIVIVEATRNSNFWNDLRLIRKRPEFELEIYERKMQAIERGREVLFGQQRFKVVMDDYVEPITSRFNVLRKK